MSWFDIKFHYACFYDDSGEYLFKKRMKKAERKNKLFFVEPYKPDGRAYHILEEDSSKTIVKNIIVDKYYTHYNINNPNPLLLDKKAEPILNSQIYNLQLQTKVARDLNTPPENGLMKLLSPKILIIGAILIIVLIWYMNYKK